MPLMKHDIVRAYAGEQLTLWFVGAGRAFRSGSDPRYTSAPHYRHIGVFSEDADGRLQCEKMEFSRHHSKISAILDRHGTLLYGQYCSKCKAPVAKTWGNCHRCATEVRVPSKETVAMLEKRVAAFKAGSTTSTALEETATVVSLVERTPPRKAPELSAVQALLQIEAQEAHLRAIVEADDPDKARLLAALLTDTINIAKKALPDKAMRTMKAAA